MSWHGAALLALVARHGLGPGPVIAVDSALSATWRRLAALGDRAICLFPPRAPASAPFGERFFGLPREGPPIHLADAPLDLAPGSQVGTDTGAKLRRVDDLFGTLDACAAIVAADREFNAGIIAGATGLIRRTRPVLLLEGIGAERPGFAAAMGELGYAALVVAASPPRQARLAVQPPAPGGPDPGWDAVCTACLLAPAPVAAALVSAGNAAGPPVPATVVVPCDDRLPSRGFYATETNGAAAWRWTGPGESAAAVLPIETPGTYDLAVRLVGYRRPALAAARLRVNRQEIACRRIEADLVGRIEIPARGFRGWIELELLHGPTESPSAADPRRLGLCVTAFIFRPA